MDSLGPLQVDLWTAFALRGSGGYYGKHGLLENEIDKKNKM